MNRVSSRSVSSAVLAPASASARSICASSMALMFIARPQKDRRDVDRQLLYRGKIIRRMLWRDPSVFQRDADFVDFELNKEKACTHRSSKSQYPFPVIVDGTLLFCHQSRRCGHCATLPKTMGANISATSPLTA